MRFSCKISGSSQERAGIIRTDIPVRMWKPDGPGCECGDQYSERRKKNI